jgi:Zn-dependent peptidase ImmA (M78 family)
MNNKGNRAKREEERNITIMKYLSHAVLHSINFSQFNFLVKGVEYERQI